MKPRIPITAWHFNYVPSWKTDIRQTFHEARERLAEEQRAKFIIKFILEKLQHFPK